MDALLKWIQTPQANSIAKVAEQKAWKTFNAKYPNADKSKFEPQTDFTKDQTATSEIYFKAGPGNLINVFGSDSKYWSPEMKSALGIGQSSEGFPQQLTPSGLKGDSLPIPAVGFHDATAWEAFTSMCQTLDRQKKRGTFTPGGQKSSQTKVDQAQKVT